MSCQTGWGIVGMLLVAASLWAAEEKSPQKPVDDAAAIEVRLAQVVVRRGLDLPEELQEIVTKHGIQVQDQPGFELKCLIVGENLKGITWNSLNLKTMETKAGRDVLLRQGKVNYQQSNGLSLYLDKPLRSRYQYFSILSDEPHWNELDGLHLKGKIDVEACERIDVLESEPLDFSEKQQLELGDYKITIEKEIILPADSRLTGFNPANPEEKKSLLVMRVDGDLKALSQVVITRFGEQIVPRSSATTGNQAEYHFYLSGDEKCVLRLTSYRNLHTVTVPFEFDVSLDEE